MLRRVRRRAGLGEERESDRERERERGRGGNREPRLLLRCRGDWTLYPHCDDTGIVIQLGNGAGFEAQMSR